MEKKILSKKNNLAISSKDIFTEIKNTEFKKEVIEIEINNILIKIFKDFDSQTLQRCLTLIRDL